MRPVKQNKGMSLDLIAEAIGGRLHGDAQKTISAAAPFEVATSDDITFVEKKRLLKRLGETSAGGIIVPAGFETPDRNIIQVDHPKLAFAKAMKLLRPASEPHWKICANTDIGRNFAHGQRAAIGPFVTIGDNVRIGNHVILHAGVIIGNDVQIGDEVEIYPNVTILNDCRIGNRVIIHAGTVIGSDGFGFVPEGSTYCKMPQWGTVQIDDDVEIGAANTIDRATFGKTWIQRGVKTDNMVHIGHNVTVGEDTILVAQVGVSGSVTIGKHAIFAGQVGVAQHIEIGDNVIIGPQAGITKSIPDGEVISGSPGIPHRLNLRVVGTLPKLPEMNKKITALEKKMERFQKDG